MSYTWRTVDFRPAAVPGWRVLLLGDSGRQVPDLAGWLIQEEIEELPYDGGSISTGTRRVVAAIECDGEAEPAVESMTYWCMLGPSDLDPTPEEEAEQRDQQEQIRALRAKAREAKAS